MCCDLCGDFIKYLDGIERFHNFYMYLRAYVYIILTLDWLPKIFEIETCHICAIVVLSNLFFIDKNTHIERARG